MKVKNKIKFIRTILIIVIILFFVSLLVPDKSYSYKELEYKTVYVLKGDTLWTIAKGEQENNPYYHCKDVRDIVQDLKKINNLTNANLKINQKLEIPTY